MDKYGLIGYPLGHSFSISYFNQKFADEGINARYENFEIASIDILTEVLDKNPDLRGLNVTIPYKEKVIPFLDSLSPESLTRRTRPYSKASTVTSSDSHRVSNPCSIRNGTRKP